MLWTTTMLPRSSGFLKRCRTECRRLRGNGTGNASSGPQQGARALPPPASQFHSMSHDGNATPPRVSHGHSGYDEEQAIGGSSRFDQAYPLTAKSVPLSCVTHEPAEPERLYHACKHGLLPEQHLYPAGPQSSGDIPSGIVQGRPCL